MTIPRIEARAVAAVISAAAGVAASAQPNVVLFFVDDMGYADWQHHPVLNPTGSHVYETPNMLRLASEGVTFFQNYSSGPVCSPSRLSLLTGKSVAKHKTSDYIGAGSTQSGALVRTAIDWPQNVAQSEVLLPEALQDSGYSTGNFGKWHMGRRGNDASDPLANGFDVNIAGVWDGNPHFAGGFFAGSDGAWTRMPGLETPGVHKPDAYLSSVISAHAATFISEQAAAGTPFFVYVPHYVVHTPIEAPAERVAYYERKLAEMSPSQIDGHDNATYAAMVHEMDDSLGRLLDALEDPDGNPETADRVRDNTVVVFTADNGGLTNYGITSNRPLRAGKGSMYEGGIREPLIVSYTGNKRVPQGSTEPTVPVIGHDIYPTILEWTRVAGDPMHNASMDGISLVPVIERGQERHRDLIWHYPHRSPQAVSKNSPVEGGAWVSAIRRGPLKLLYFYDERRFELYDVIADPSESVNLFDSTHPSVQSMSQSLFHSLRSSNALMPRDVGNELALPGPSFVDDAFVSTHDSHFASAFDVTHDFISGDVGPSGFDGVVNPSSAVTFDQGASIAGSLAFRNTSATRLVAGDITSPIVFKRVTGDFDAAIEIGSIPGADYHVIAIVAGPEADLAENFLWIGQQVRHNGAAFAQSRNIIESTRIAELIEGGLYPYYRLIRRGSSFVGLFSSSGSVWTPFVEFDRPDLPQTLAVGITQALFSNASETGTVRRIQINPPPPQQFDDRVGDRHE